MKKSAVLLWIANFCLLAKHSRKSLWRCTDEFVQCLANVFRFRSEENGTPRQVTRLFDFQKWSFQNKESSWSASILSIWIDANSAPANVGLNVGGQRAHMSCRNRHEDRNLSSSEVIGMLRNSVEHFLCQRELKTRKYTPHMNLGSCFRLNQKMPWCAKFAAY